ncbi:Tripartite-type tricarboxylate transporter, receptor component TctC [Polaromonas sp. OV174]|uniref:Bug family tripartite tricarboxylate transporter substrate binding protein n=1 Tax=Polaromonas sp. OV174 TaxID=1855300 RepID=UPI0008F26086|nr:tripartite tricarboxylate transporter substrate binding protein [Polaromonas sp. OV174]SFC72413.1 Tripartite-type tricarboxylate transporter, receptor component TctC [Polaromonas sp. OV174]
MRSFPLAVNPQRRRLALASLAGLCLPGMATAQQAAYPAKPVTLVVGNVPGGSIDLFARALAKRLQDVLGQTVLVDNKPAGGGLIANRLTARAPADGYTLVVVTSTFTVGAAIRTDLGYDSVTGFKPVAILAKGPLLATVASKSPFKTIGDVVAYAKANPGKLNYGTSGLGSINHFATELFSYVAGIKMTHVPYKGMGMAMTDLRAGQIQVLFASAPAILGQVRDGGIRALAVTSEARSPVAPELPSLDEAGYKGSAFETWWGVLAPAGTPQLVVERLNTEINKIVQSKEMRDFFLKEGADALVMRPAEFEAFVAADIQHLKKVAKASNIRSD